MPPDACESTFEAGALVVKRPLQNAIGVDGQFVSDCIQVLTRHGGSIEARQGTSIIALFPAIHAALAAAAVVAQRSRGTGAGAVRVGLAHGSTQRCIMGRHKGRCHSMVIGPALQDAASAASKAGPGQVVAHSSCLSMLPRDGLGLPMAPLHRSDDGPLDSPAVCSAYFSVDDVVLEEAANRFACPETPKPAVQGHEHLTTMLACMVDPWASCCAAVGQLEELLDPCSCVFVRVRSTQITPDLCRACLHVIEDIAHSSNGFVASCMVDDESAGILVCFRDASSACQAAQRMHERLSSSATGARPCFGIATGPCIRHVSGGVTGNPVDVAVRLSSPARAGALAIITDEETFSKVCHAGIGARFLGHMLSRHFSVGCIPSHALATPPEIRLPGPQGLSCPLLGNTLVTQRLVQVTEMASSNPVCRGTHVHLGSSVITMMVLLKEMMSSVPAVADQHWLGKVSEGFWGCDAVSWICSRFREHRRTHASEVMQILYKQKFVQSAKGSAFPFIDGHFLYQFSQSASSLIAGSEPAPSPLSSSVPPVVLLVGDPGSGKTTLLEHLRCAVSELPIDIMSTRWDPSVVDIYHGWGDIIRCLMQLRLCATGTDTTTKSGPETLEAQLHALLQNDIPNCSMLLSLLNPILQTCFAETAESRAIVDSGASVKVFQTVH